MKSSVIFLLTLVIALIIAIPIYWALLFLLDMAVGTQQLYAWVQFESRHLLLMQLLSDSGYLALAFTPVMALVIAASQIQRFGPIISVALPIAIAALAYMALVAIGFSPPQAGLHVASGVIAAALAVVFRHLTLKTHRG